MSCGHFASLEFCILTTLQLTGDNWFNSKSRVWRFQRLKLSSWHVVGRSNLRVFLHNNTGPMMGHFTCFTKKMPQKCANNFGLYERKARLAKSCMPPYWLGHFSGCWSAERPQLSNFASRSKELSSLEGEHTGDLYLVGCTQKKWVICCHSIMEHARAIAHRILGYPGTTHVKHQAQLGNLKQMSCYDVGIDINGY